MKKGIIYCAYNLVNGKRYIGQTVQRLSERKAAHYNKNGAPFFHKALIKYKKEDWEWKVIDTAYTKEELNNKEIFWIAFFDTTNPYKGYNIQKGGQNTIQTKEEIKYARERLMNVIRKEYSLKDKMVKSILCVETGEIFCDCRAAANAYGIKSNSHITEVLKGKHKTAGGYHWAYSNDISCFKNAFFCVELNKTYISFLQASQEDGFSSFHLSNRLKEKSPCTYGGYTFKWLNR